MPSPFPGMNPCLDDPELWPAIHHDLLTTLRDALLPQLVPQYFVTIELREYEISLADLELSGIGDVSIIQERQQARGTNGSQRTMSAAVELQAREGTPAVLTVDVPRPVPVREHFLEIRRPRSHELITVIDVLSPTNKRSRKGRQQYEETRLTIAQTRTNLVEIDLIRSGDPLPVLHHGALLPRDMAGDYRVLVLRGGPPRGAALYRIGLREPLPVVPIPLRPGEPDAHVDLQAALHAAYDRGRYDVAVDYRGDALPPLGTEDAGWADTLLRQRGLR